MLSQIKYKSNSHDVLKHDFASLKKDLIFATSIEGF